MKTVTVVGSGKYFTKLQSIELRVTFNGTGGVEVQSLDSDMAVVTAQVKEGERNWGRWAGDTMEALGRFYYATHDEVPSEELFEAWHVATAVVWKRALNS